MPRVLPRPRNPHGPLDGSGPTDSLDVLAAVRQRYEDGMGWPTAPTEPLELLTGVRFDVLEMPADAGSAVLRRWPLLGPVALLRTGGDANPPGNRPKLLALIAPGGAEELPGILEWLEWGALAGDLMARGAGGRMPAPAFPFDPSSPAAFGSWEAAVWVRPPRTGHEAENSLPATGFGAGIGDGGGVPDLVRLVSAAATECHRARLLRARNAQSDRVCGDQALAFSNASRMSAGTRPRSLTL
ncbi:SCO3374 family protein [Streptomyces sp. NRRL S-337]|uniref:SCO3374 family protein n=1 Tax=Streptomyces sp. NRRL S-337 TaxID=1463900 RepID=UPI00099B92F8|nr:SCO3374 family protein [Streptomyces sp. NRRL S-337]